MSVLCPRCGESSSSSEWHCKKCGFSIKNYLDNQKRFNKEFNSENVINGSASVCLKEDEEAVDRTDDVQENIMRLLSNIKIVPNQEKCELNKAIVKKEHKIKEEILQDNLKVVSKNNDEIALKDKDSVEAIDIKKNTKIKNEPVKIIAKKVAEDVIILPPNRVKVEIEAAKEVVKDKELHKEATENIIEDKELHKEESEDIVRDKVNNITDNVECNKSIEQSETILTDEIVENKIKKIKEELSEGNISEIENEDIDTKEDVDDYIEESTRVSIKDSKEKSDGSIDDNENAVMKIREALIQERAVPCTDGYTFREFLTESREYNDGIRVILIMSGVILVLVALIILITSTASAAML